MFVHVLIFNTQFYQRPVPTGAQDIGTWLSIFQFLSIAAVITNAALICFTMDVLWDRFSLAGRLWIFIGFQWVLMSIQFISQEIIDDVPLEVQIQMERNEFINLKVIEKVADEDYGVVVQVEEADLVEGGKEKRGPIHCGNLCGIRFKPERPRMRTVKSRRIREDLAPYSVFEYPEAASSAGSWPKPLCRQKDGATAPSIRQQKEAAKEAARANFDTSSYISQAAAVAAPTTYSAVPNPAPPSGKNSPTGPANYSAVPPPAPGYL